MAASSAEVAALRADVVANATAQDGRIAAIELNQQGVEVTRQTLQAKADQERFAIEAKIGMLEQQHQAPQLNDWFSFHIGEGQRLIPQMEL